ncbi:uncharacterized protein LOC62_07G008889 [Vanrija pseudolonga]|uniref:Uncharacterized protein n=1 Tax=Vanrija pseudolonga TaxID=143232 RepID=A0AAF0YER4_9TREE|nr:hypothetical protein LOC62_07G008889 [Vanrija pseudolonga]
MGRRSSHPLPPSQKSHKFEGYSIFVQTFNNFDQAEIKQSIRENYGDVVDRIHNADIVLVLPPPTPKEGNYVYYMPAMARTESNAPNGSFEGIMFQLGTEVVRNKYSSVAIFTIGWVKYCLGLEGKVRPTDAKAIERYGVTIQVIPDRLPNRRPPGFDIFQPAPSDHLPMHLRGLHGIGFYLHGRGGQWSGWDGVIKSRKKILWRSPFAM